MNFTTVIITVAGMSQEYTKTNQETVFNKNATHAYKKKTMTSIRNSINLKQVRMRFKLNSSNDSSLPSILESRLYLKSL